MKIFLFVFTSLIFVAAHSQGLLKADEFETKLKASKDAQVLDVRTKKEYDANHLSNAFNADYNNTGQFAERTAALDKNKPVFVYCLAGGRSAEATKILINKGFREVYDLKGGIRSWIGAGKKVEEGMAIAKMPGIDAIQFEKLLIGASNSWKKLCLVDFNAKWCAPCVKMKTGLEEISSSMLSKVGMVYLDINENENLSKQMNAEGIPLLVLYKNGKEAWRHEGYLDKKSIIEIINKN